MSTKANKVTSKLSEEEKQELYKTARTSKQYQNIWKEVGKCVFCDLRDKYIIYEENGIALTVNLYPYIDGQLMAIPRRHVRSSKELSEIEWNTLKKMSYIAKKIIRKVHKHKGVWHLIREGGASAQMSVTDHLHLQVIPFDSNDLCKWNFRKLSYTPLQNTKLYRNAFKTIKKAAEKFEIEYSHKQMFPIVNDLVLLNEKGEVLLQKRRKQNRIKNIALTLPGGHFQNSKKSLLDELIREIKEEIHFEPKKECIQILHSELSQITHLHTLSYSEHAIEKPERFLWNVYKYNKRLTPVEVKSLRPGDDCDEIVWASLANIKKYNHINVSTGLKHVLDLL